MIKMCGDRSLDNVHFIRSVKNSHREGHEGALRKEKMHFLYAFSCPLC
jgi:hypothetical protein